MQTLMPPTTSSVPPIALTLYSRRACHLCDEMKDVVMPLARELGCVVEEIDISGDPELERHFGTEVPVLFVNGRKAFKYRATDREVRKRLQAERRGA
jgi:glutaredoxin